MPTLLDQPPVWEMPAPAPAPSRPPWWRRLFPGTRQRTRNAAPSDDDALLIDNRTSEPWHVHVGYRDLGIVAPRAHLRTHVVKTGLLTARQPDAPTGSDYLQARLSATTSTAEIHRSVVMGTVLYDLRLVS